MARKIMIAKDRVRHFLQEYPSLRDDNSRLVANVWYEELKEKDVNISKEAKDILEHVASHLTSAETITRTSRLLQNKISSLRGDDWKKRQRYNKKYIKQIKDVAAQITGE